MAFLPQDQENTSAPVGQTTNQPTSTPPPTSGGSIGGGAAKTSSGGTPTQFGSSASKLGDYLSANAPQIQQQGQTVANQLNNQFQQIGTDITNAGQQFGQQVSQGYAAPNQDLVNQAVANPTQFAQDPNNVSAFQAQYNNQYKGPQNFEGSGAYSNINNEVNQAVQNAGLLNTQGGLQGYLAQNQGGHQTRASNTLDALLLQGNPQSQAAIQQAVNQFGSLSPQVHALTAQQDAAIQQAQQQAQASQQYSQNAINPVAQGFNQNLLTGAQAAEAQRGQYNQTGQENYQNAYDKLTPWLNAFNQGTQLNVVNPVQQFNPLNSPISAANFATPEQYAEAQALQQLIGSGYQSPLDQANAAQAGTAYGQDVLAHAPAYNPADLATQLAEQAGLARYGQLGMPNNPTLGLENLALLGADNPGSPLETLLGQLYGLNPNTIHESPFSPGEFTFE